ncbi:MAG: hypothetical protein IPH32_09645 [Bacteroidetes bacterium]|nr:hypothetical protein [Bacteroidota bacterium]
MEIFKSNMPLYFADHELGYFSDFLDRDASIRGHTPLFLKTMKLLAVVALL